MEEICNKLFELAKPYLTVRNNQVHTESSYAFALKLLERLGGRPEIVLPAIILHDVGWSAIPEGQHSLAFGPGEIDEKMRHIHEVEGAKIAGRLLEEVPLINKDCREICRIIESHDSGNSPLTLEEKMVKDADKLYRYTPKCFVWVMDRFSMQPLANWERLHRSLNQWFFLDYSKELAATKLKELKVIFID